MLKILEEFNSKIVAIDSEYGSELDGANKRIRLSRETLLRMRELVVENGFKNVKEEIQFFKITKQHPLSNLLLNQNISKLEFFCPKSSLDNIKTYLKKELSRCDKFFLSNIEFGHYMHSRATYLDEIYFTRKTNFNGQFEFQQPALYDLQFNTPKDMLLAKFKVYPKLITHIKRKIKMLSAEKFNTKSKSFNLKWTGKKVELIELIYALQATERIKTGQISINELASVFETIFEIDLGNYYRKYIEIRSRKIERTKFLDSLKEQLIRRMDEADN